MIRACVRGEMSRIAKEYYIYIYMWTASGRGPVENLVSLDVGLDIAYWFLVGKKKIST